jgi:hypothetical protein
MKLVLSQKNFLQNTQISNFMKIRPVGGELFHADGQTEITKLTVAFRNFVNAPNNNLSVQNMCNSKERASGHFKPFALQSNSQLKFGFYSGRQFSLQRLNEYPLARSV